jgi:hypothetical protein
MWVMINRTVGKQAVRRSQRSLLGEGDTHFKVCLTASVKRPTISRCALQTLQLNSEAAEMLKVATVC